MGLPAERQDLLRPVLAAWPHLLLKSFHLLLLKLLFSLSLYYKTGLLLYPFERQDLLLAFPPRFVQSDDPRYLSHPFLDSTLLAFPPRFVQSLRKHVVSRLATNKDLQIVLNERPQDGKNLLFLALKNVQTCEPKRSNPIPGASSSQFLSGLLPIPLTGNKAEQLPRRPMSRQAIFQIRPILSLPVHCSLHSR